MDFQIAIESRRLHFVALALVGLSASACASTGATGERDLTTTSELIQLLEDDGVSLFRAGTATDLQFSTTGQAYDVGRGGMLHVYEYDNAQQASLDAMRADGGLASGASVFQSGNLVAVYLGNNLSVRSALSRLMGPQLY